MKRLILLMLVGIGLPAAIFAQRAKYQIRHWPASTPRRAFSSVQDRQL